MEEHKGYIQRGEWAKSGLASLKENCDIDMDWDNVEILAKINSRSKKQAALKLDFMESLMIKLHRTGPGHGFNKDKGQRFYTKQWDPILNKLREKMGLG